MIVTSYVFNNARLLLLSKMGTPYNPVTGKGSVGKNYAYQNGGASASGFFDDTRLPALHGRRRVCSR